MVEMYIKEMECSSCNKIFKTVSDKVRMYNRMRCPDCSKRGRGFVTDLGGLHTEEYRCHTCTHFKPLRAETLSWGNCGLGYVNPSEYEYGEPLGLVDSLDVCEDYKGKG